MFTKRDRNEIRKIRHERVRKKISGTPEMPRLSVYRSLNNIYVQVIDDVAGKTLVSCSTLDPQIKGQLSELDKKGAGKLIGKTVESVRCRPASRRSSSTAAATFTPAAWRRSPQAPVKRASTSDSREDSRNASGYGKETAGARRAPRARSAS